MRTILLAAACLIALCLPALAAVATVPVATGPDSTTTIVTSSAVHIPWGDWISAVIEQIVLPLLGAILVGFLALITARLAPYLPPWLRAVLNAKNTAALEQLLQPAIATGLQNVAADTSGKVLTIKASSPAVDAAVQYAVDHGPDHLIAWAGGVSAIRQKIAARIAMMSTPPVPSTTAPAATATAIVAPVPEPPASAEAAK